MHRLRNGHKLRASIVGYHWLNGQRVRDDTVAKLRSRGLVEEIQEPFRNIMCSYIVAKEVSADGV